MLKELFDGLVEHAKVAARPTLFRREGDCPWVYWVASANGVLARYEDLPAPAELEADDIRTAARVATQWVDAGASPEAWVHHGELVVYRDMQTRREHVTLKADHSEILKRLTAWKLRSPLDQGELVTLLRTDLYPYLVNVGSILSGVSSVKFSKNEAGETEITKTKASIGKSLQLEMKGAHDLPDYIEFQIPVFASRHLLLAMTVKCAFLILPDKQKFVVAPLPEEIEKAVHAGDLFLAAELQRALCGDPPSPVLIHFGVAVAVAD